MFYALRVLRIEREELTQLQNLLMQTPAHVIYSCEVYRFFQLLMILIRIAVAVTDPQQQQNFAIPV